MELREYKQRCKGRGWDLYIEAPAENGFVRASAHRVVDGQSTGTGLMGGGKSDVQAAADIWGQISYEITEDHPSGLPPESPPSE